MLLLAEQMLLVLLAYAGAVGPDSARAVVELARAVLLWVLLELLLRWTTHWQAHLLAWTGKGPAHGVAGAGVRTPLLGRSPNMLVVLVGDVPLILLLGLCHALHRFTRSKQCI